MKVKLISVMVMIAFCSTISGCSYVEKHQSEAVGAGVGAGGGALIGGLLGGTRGAIAGGLLGAIAGGVIGHYLNKQTQTEQQTAQKYNYQPSQGTMVTIEQNSVSPETVSPGGTVTLSTTYAVLTPDHQEASVTETRKIEHNGNLVGNPQVTVNRTGGTYATSLPLQLPSNAAPGVYNVITTVRTTNASDTRETRFTVSG